jgi:hypothetical protein
LTTEQRNLIEWARGIKHDIANEAKVLEIFRITSPEQVEAKRAELVEACDIIEKGLKVLRDFIEK